MRTSADSVPSNTNNIARVENSQLTSANDKLWVLHSLKTNRPLEKFPATAKDIAKLTGKKLLLCLIL